MLDAPQQIQHRLAHPSPTHGVDTRERGRPWVVTHTFFYHARLAKLRKKC